MAIVYLYDGGSNTSPYDDWTKAATTYATAAGYMTVASDVIYMAQDHQQSGTSFSLNSASGDSYHVRVPIYSMERTGTTYAPATAYNFKATSTTLTINDYLDAHGVWFETADDNITFSSVNGSTCKDCTFRIINAAGNDDIGCPFYGFMESCAFGDIDAWSSPNVSTLLNCSFNHTGAAPRQFNSADGAVLIGGSVSGDATYIASGQPNFVHTAITSAVGSRLTDQVSATGQIHAEFYATDRTGASYARDWWTQTNSRAGYCQPTTAIYRDAGWEDTPSETNLSWKMVTDSTDAGYHGAWLYSPPITSRIEETGSTTFTAYGVEDFTTGPYQTEFAMHLFYLGTADSQGWDLATSAGDPEATTSLTSDTATWTGASGKTKFKIAQTVTINTPGEWMVRFLMKKYESGKAVWIDPKIEIT